jgi:hypothetical protein
MSFPLVGNPPLTRFRSSRNDRGVNYAAIIRSIHNGKTDN